MIRAIFRSFEQIMDPASRRVIIYSLVLAVLVFAGLMWLAGFAIEALPDFEEEWFATLVGWLARLGLVMVAWVFFPSVASLFAGLFLDHVADATEAKHYADDGPGTPSPFLATVWAAVRYGAVVILGNVAILPVYLMLYLFPPLIPVLFYSLNAYLLSREFFELVAHRHMGWKAARALRKANQKRIFVAGLFITLFFTLPLLNLVAPVLSTIFMVHVFKDVAVRKDRPEYKSMRESLEDELGGDAF